MTLFETELDGRWLEHERIGPDFNKLEKFS